MTYNFSAGPAVLPAEVMAQAQHEFCNWRNGMSAIEVSHRGPEFAEVIATSKQDCRDLLNISDDYEILFLQGGATTQFAAIPLNLLGNKLSADYICTGHWSKKAIEEAHKYTEVNVAADATDNGFTDIPAFDSWNLRQDAAYVHYAPNETIHGVEFDWIPDTQGVSLVADMSSNIMSQPVDVSRFGLIYAGAQKNLGPAGVTLVIVRKDLLGNAMATTPSTLDYAIQAKADSCYNTAPTFTWYMVGLVLKWIKQQGGLAAMAKHNAEKSQLLYKFIDQTDFYHNNVDTKVRSRMNIPFHLADKALENNFLEQATAAGLMNLKGHRAVGGMRASLYNAMPVAGVQALVEFMRDFAQRNG